MLSILIPFVFSTMCLAGGDSSVKSETTPPVEQEIQACSKCKFAAASIIVEDPTDEVVTDDTVAELPPVQEPVRVEKDEQN